MAEWACTSCKWPPVDGTLQDSLNPDMKLGVCSNLSCKTRDKVKVKLRNNVRGAEYAEHVGKTMFRRSNVPPKGDAPG